MHTAYITHPACLKHEMSGWHPESPARLKAIDDRLHAAHLLSAEVQALTNGVNP